MCSLSISDKTPDGKTREIERFNGAGSEQESEKRKEWKLEKTKSCTKRDNDCVRPKEKRVKGVSTLLSKYRNLQLVFPVSFPFYYTHKLSLPPSLPHGICL